MDTLHGLGDSIPYGSNPWGVGNDQAAARAAMRTRMPDAQIRGPLEPNAPKSWRKPRPSVNSPGDSPVGGRFACRGTGKGGAGLSMGARPIMGRLIGQALAA